MSALCLRVSNLNPRCSMSGSTPSESNSCFLTIVECFIRHYGQQVVRVSADDLWPGLRIVFPPGRDVYVKHGENPLEGILSLSVFERHFPTADGNAMRWGTARRTGYRGQRGQTADFAVLKRTAMPILSTFSAGQQNRVG
jgi:hypothetical protein